MSSSKTKKAARPIKMERESQASSDQEGGFHDSNNNNCARAPDWKSSLKESDKASKEDVYQFDEDEGDDDSLQGVKKNIIPKSKDVRRPAGKSGKLSPSSKIPIVKSEILQLKQEISNEEEGALEQPAGATTHAAAELYGNGRVEQAASAIVPKPECRKSARRRPSVLYIEDPFQIILDSDELEDFDFENGEMFLSRKSDSTKKQQRFRAGRKQSAAKPKVKRTITPKQEPLPDPEPEPEIFPEILPEPQVEPQPEVESVPEPEPELDPDPDPPEAEQPEEEEQEEEEEEPEELSSRESPPICEYRIEPITPKAPSTSTPPPTPPAAEKTPQVNPIFLWVRQEDSFIVDVRCEDYDKRNRIRLLKSANGSWRAMPRTEAGQDLSTRAKSGARIKHKSKRSKQKKSKKKKKRHRHHRRMLVQVLDKQMQSCKVSLVPLPDLMLDRSASSLRKNQEVSVNQKSQRSKCNTGGVDGQQNKTHVPNASLDDEDDEDEDEDSASYLHTNNNNSNHHHHHHHHLLHQPHPVSANRKHVRFALDHSEDSSNEQSGGGGDRSSSSTSSSNSSEDGQEGKTELDRRQYSRRREQMQRNSSSLFVASAREEMTAKDASAPVQQQLSCNNQRAKNSNNNNKSKGPFSPAAAAALQSFSALGCVVVKEEEQDGGGEDEDVGKSELQQKSAKSRGDRDATENGEAADGRESAQCPGNASPVVVTREPLLSTSDTPRRRVASRSAHPGHNNNHQQRQCTESSASLVTEKKNSGQTPRTTTTTAEQEFSEQGTGIFTAADDVNNNNCGGLKEDKNASAAVLLTSEDEVIVISDSRSGRETDKDRNYLVIEDDDEEVVSENQQGRTEEFANAVLQHPAVIEIKEQDGDDDVTFVCSSSSKSAIEESLASLSEVIAREDIASNNNNIINNPSGGAGGLGDALQHQQHQSRPQARILTPEEQLHESLKATTELIAGIGGFGFVSSLDEDNMSFVDDVNCLGSGVGGGNGAGGQDVKVSTAQQQQQQMVNATLHNSLASFCSSAGGGGGGTGTGTGRDEYNDDDEMLMDGVAPVADIISRLSDSPKCLTFNEMGEIEAISANAALFEKHTMDSMDVLAMSIKELAEKNIKELAAKAVVAAAAAAAASGNKSNMTTIVTPDSCGGGGVGGEEYPRDLTCNRSSSVSNNNSTSSGHNNKTKLSPLPRPVSRGSDAIQSPQPSGLPAIPQSPDIFSSNTRPKSVFLESILSTPSPSKTQNSFTSHQQSQQQLPSSDGGGVGEGNGSGGGGGREGMKQKEPLDLGTCRKSASPTVTCSEEVSKRHHDEIVDLVSELESSSASSSTSESSRKRIKYESSAQSEEREKLENLAKKHSSRDKLDQDGQGNKLESSDKNDSSKSAAESVTGYLMDILNTNAKDPDPLTQLRLLISNTEWKVPETLLVPKDRLNAVLASPAREIPLLLTTRPELRLPGAFAFPSILQDPDILVVSLAQLEAILEKQQEIFKLKANERSAPPPPQPKRDQEMRPKQQQQQPPISATKTQHISEKQHENLMHQQIQRAISNKLGSTQQKAVHPNIPVNMAGPQGGAGGGGGGGMGSGLANDIDAATIAAFNQMLWLPYLNQMRGQLTPEVIKAVAGFNEMLPLLAAQSRIQQGLMTGQNTSNNNNNNSGGNSLSNSLEFAMWQEAMLNANNANLRAILKGQQPSGSGSGGGGGAGSSGDFVKKQMDHRKASSSSAANFPAPGKVVKHQADNQHLPNPLSPLSIPPFVPPAAMQASSRYFNPMMAQQNRSPMPSPTNPLHSPFSPNYRQQPHGQAAHQQQQQQQQQRGGHRFSNMFSPTGQPQSQHMKKGGMAMPPNQFFPFAQNQQSTMDYDDQMNLLASKKAQKELEQVLQMQQQQQQQQHRLQSQQAKFAQEQKMNKMNMFSSAAQSMQQQQQQMNSFLNSAKMSLHHHQQQQQQQMFNQQMMNQLNELSKLSSLMAMPSAFDSPLNANPLLAAQQASVAAAAAAAVGGQDHGSSSQMMNEGGGGGGSQQKLKLKVKPGMHLLDPMAMQRRLLTNHSTESADEMSAEIVSTTTSQSGMDTSSSPDINSPLWHPLFGNSGQKMGSGGSTYTSPWQWTTITTAGE